MSPWSANFRRAIAVAAALVVLFELALRLAGFHFEAAQPDYFVGSEENPFRIENGSFVANTDSFFFPETVPVNKDPREVRVVFLGASNVFALGHVPGLARSLSARWGRPVRIINVSGGGFSTTRLLAAMPACLALKPDVFLLYSGHNEFLEPLLLGRSTGSALERLRTFQLAELAVHALGLALMNRYLLSVGQGKPLRLPRPWSFPRGPTPGHAVVRRAYESALTRMILIAKDAGIPLVIGSTAYNRRSRPFAPGNDSFERAESEYARENYPEALKLYDEATELDRDPRRSSPSLNMTVRELAGKYGVPLADVDAVIVQHSLHGIPGPDLFVDHCHFTGRGNELLEQAFLDALGSIRIPVGGAR